jgi:hypothetical protein
VTVEGMRRVNVYIEQTVVAKTTDMFEGISYDHSKAKKSLLRWL